MKIDAAGILAKVDELVGAAFLGKAGADWPNHLYHFADVQNAASILREGMLYSRTQCSEKGLLALDSADQEVIAQSEWAHQYVRLYFAPRTPTQYHMEGIRPPEHRRHGAHCPVPIFFVFNARELLVRDDCQFSNGNLAAHGHAIGSDAKFFRSLPFKDIYHRGVLPELRKNEIIYARHAEVLFGDSLDLDHLQEVVCRTGPERETLLNLLGRGAARSLKSIIRLEKQGEALFERRWYYVREIAIIDDAVHVQFAGPQPAAQPQYLEVRYPDESDFRRLRPQPVTGSRVTYRLPKETDRLLTRLTIIDALAYYGMLTSQTLF